MVRELRVEEPKKEIAWDAQVEFYHEMVYDGVPLPQDFRETLGEEFAHLAPAPQVRAPENERAWDAYLLWAGDITEDLRTPRERLEAYYDEQEEAAL